MFGFSPYEQELLSVSILQVTLLKAMPDIILLLRRSSSHSLLWMKLHSSMRRKAPPLLREAELSRYLSQIENNELSKVRTT